MNNQNVSSESKAKNILTSIISWILGIIFAIAGLNFIFSHPIFAIFLILTAVVLIPPLLGGIAKKLNITLSKNVKMTLVLVLLILAGFNINSGSSSPVSVSSAPNPVQNIVPTNSQPAQDSTKDRKIMSIVFAEKVIKDMLKSPSTAQFSDVAAYELSNKKDVWAVNGYVDSQNSYGAMLRNQWEVQLDYRDGAGGTVLSILFDGKKVL